MTDEKSGWAVAVIRHNDLHCGFWHKPAGDTLWPPGCGYTGVPFVQPANARQYPPLVFETEVEAEIACEYFDTIWGRNGDPANWREDVYPGEYWARPQVIKAYPNHKLTMNGFKPLPMRSRTKQLVMFG